MNLLLGEYPSQDERSTSQLKYFITEIIASSFRRLY
jgi:hypothetical protein